MRSISMNYVTPAFVARRKCVTRRQWKESYAKSFKAGDRLTVVDKDRRYGGVPIGVLELTEAPYMQNIGLNKGMELALYEDEGFAFMEDNNVKPEFAPLKYMTMKWVDSFQNLLVVPFEIIEVDEVAKAKYLTKVEMDGARNRLFTALTKTTIAKYVPEDAYLVK